MAKAVSDGETSRSVPLTPCCSTSRRERRLAHVARASRGLGRRPSPLSCASRQDARSALGAPPRREDRDPRGRRAAFATITKTLGGIDILCNNAGIETIRMHGAGETRRQRQFYALGCLAQFQYTLLWRGAGSAARHRTSPPSGLLRADQLCRRCWRWSWPERPKAALAAGRAVSRRQMRLGEARSSKRSWIGCDRGSSARAMR
jgi:NAD(P)-dependent dehydrogenase (short-subunit alcohol dehydrogenase family)